MDTFNALRPWKFRRSRDYPVVPEFAADVYTELANEQGHFDRESMHRFLKEHQKDSSVLTQSNSEVVWKGVRKVVGKAATFNGGSRNMVKQPLAWARSISNMVVQGGKKVTHQLGTSREEGLTAEEFFTLLLEPSFTPAIETQVTQDMTAPLSHYFIYTGHNSYLKGNQLTSQSSTRPIVKSLQRGVRVIELDLWPNDKKTEILVMHGGTLTKPVDFQECIEAIREHAFDASDYPVIVTLEDHLPNMLQAKAAKIIASVLSDVLWTPPPGPPMCSYPSPEQLKGRILISTQPPKMDKNVSKDEKDKKRKETLSTKVAAERLAMDHNEDPALVESSMTNVLSNPGSSEGSPDPSRRQSMQALEEGGGWDEGPIFSKRFVCLDSSDEEAQEKKTMEEDPSMQADVAVADCSENTAVEYVDPRGCETDEERVTQFHSLVQQYRGMITIAGGKMKGVTPKVSLMDGPEIKRVSLSESQLAAVAKSHPDDLVRFTQKNVLRIYPTGVRIDSSNYNPVLGWTHGAQLVALNMQGHGRPLWLVRGFFMGNGGSGFIKKPSYFFEKKERPSPEEQVGDNVLEYWNPRFPGPVKKVLEVRVLLGTGWRQTFGKKYYDKFSPPDFYVKVGLEGVPDDTEMKKLPVQQDQWNPTWADHVLDFPLRAPELALLKIEVLEYDQGKSDDFAGQAVLPVWFLKEGFRCVPLLDKKGRPLGRHKKTKKKDGDPSPPPSPQEATRQMFNKHSEADQVTCQQPRLLFYFRFKDA